MARRLTSAHPHQKKFNRLCELADQLGVRIIPLGTRTLVTIDGVPYDLEDFETAEPLHEFPPQFEYKLVEGRE